MIKRAIRIIKNYITDLIAIFIFAIVLIQSTKIIEYIINFFI